MFSKRHALGALGITVTYAVFGVTWILFTDYILMEIISSPSLLSGIQQSKSWLFLALTSVFLYFLVSSGRKTSLNEQNDSSRFEESASVHRRCDEAEKQAQVLDKLMLAAGQSILDQEPLEHTLSLICSELVHSLGNTCALIAYKEADSRITFPYAAGIDPELVPELISEISENDEATDDVITATIRTGQTQVRDYDERSCAFLPFLPQAKPGTIVAFPLKDRSGPFGALVLISAASHLSHPQIIAKYENLAHQVAIAVSFAKRHDDLTYQIYYDALTGLPNRRLFDERLEQSLARAGGRSALVAVLFLDIDHFNLVNDILGHEAGDTLLQNISERLAACLSPKDTLARSGEDEFLIILPGIQTKEEAGTVAKRLLDALISPFAINDQEVFVSGSIGIAVYPFDGDDADTLVKNAGSAMSYAKNQGRNNFQYFVKQLNLNAYINLTLYNHLRKALEHSEFEVHYQPQVNLLSGEITGTEALIRWHSQALGEVSPSQFIPVAEETGLIIPIGEWVLREAIKTNKSWQDQGFPPRRIAVNLSGRQLYQEDLLQTITAILEETGHPPQWLELEITESIAMENLDFTAKILARIKEMGVRIAIDDFGKGFSSLNYLRRLPLDTLKIDRSFIQDIYPSQSGREIVNAIINLAHTLNLKVIAEGVETLEQLVYLRAKGCDEIQGYLFSKALPASEIAELFQQDRHLILCCHSGR